MKTQAVVVAAGMGTRMGSGVPKVFLPLAGRPVLAHALQAFEDCSLIASVIVVVHDHFLRRAEEMVREYGLGKAFRVIPGGETRRDSVYQGLLALDEDTRFVAVHDGARPLLSLSVLEQAVRRAYDEQAVVVGLPVKPTIKRIDPNSGRVKETLDRTVLWEAQTPQVFDTGLLMKAHQQVRDRQATDDAMLVEQCGHTVRMVKGEERNLKITTRGDMILAGALFEQEPVVERGRYAV